MYGVDYNLELDLVTISLIAQVLVGWYLVSIVHELPDMILPGSCQPGMFSHVNNVLRACPIFSSVSHL